MHASDAINMLAKVSEKRDMLSPIQKLYRRAPFSCLLPFLKLGLHHVKRTLESELKAQACFSWAAVAATRGTDARHRLCLAASRTLVMSLATTRGKRPLGLCLRRGAGIPRHRRRYYRRRNSRKTSGYDMYVQPPPSQPSPMPSQLSPVPSHLSPVPSKT